MRDAELSSLSSSLEEIMKRLSSYADRCARSGTEDEAREMFGIERSLASAVRKLTKINERS